ncbi:MAG TPA: metalloregulator ArsR/SmtB family transcription factor [Candidatus Nitrosotenuis sp.]|nr:metalloregulator ArsR/SmtB family transcription factor [Candidatus Nitrosotenuis sp.]
MKVPALLKCICEETRFNILEILQKNSEMSVNDLATKLKKDQPLISHHLRALKECNIVKSRENGKMTMYSIASKDLAKLVSDITKASERLVTCCESSTCC